MLEYEEPLLVVMTMAYSLHAVAELESPQEARHRSRAEAQDLVLA